MSKLAQEVLNDRITKENIAEKLKYIDEIVDAMKNYAERQQKSNSEQFNKAGAKSSTADLNEGITNE